MSLMLAASCFGGETLLVEQDGRFNDEPTMVRASDGSIYVAWNGFRNGADALMIARYRFADGQFQSLGSWQVLGGAGTYILNPKVIAGGDSVFVLYAAEHGRQWDIFALPCGSGGPGRPIAVTADQPVDIKPDGVWRNGILWVTWESNRDNSRRILLASVQNGKVSKPEVVSQEGRSNYGPSIAIESNGAISVAWHSFREHNYDIFLRRRSSSGKWGAEKRLTTAPSIDRHPVLLTHQDDLWVFYENCQMQGYRTGSAKGRRIIVAKVTPNGLRSPKGLRASSLYGSAKTDLAAGGPGPSAESASPAFDSMGRLWVAYLKPRLPRAGWEVWFTGYNGSDWEQPKSLANLKGMDRRPAILMDGDTALFAFQFDDFPQTWVHDTAVTPRSKSRIMLVFLDLRQSAPAASRMDLEPLAEPEGAFEPGTLRVAYGEGTAAPAIDYRGKKLKLLYGDLHTHSDISVCNRCGDQSVDENYQVRRDLNRLDFACMTDHDYNFVPYLWNYTAKMARVNEDPVLDDLSGHRVDFQFRKVRRQEPLWLLRPPKPDPG